jgi:hypothetical protein
LIIKERDLERVWALNGYRQPDVVLQATAAGGVPENEIVPTWSSRLSDMEDYRAKSVFAAISFMRLKRFWKCSTGGA